jgi:hypothetical protein
MVWIAQLAFFASFFAFGETKTTSYFICKSKGSVRTVRVELDEQGVCHTFYSKNGIDKAIGSGRNKESCQHFSDNVIRNLENSGWKCREAAQATKSSEVEK